MSERSVQPTSSAAASALGLALHGDRWHCRRRRDWGQPGAGPRTIRYVVDSGQPHLKGKNPNGRAESRCKAGISFRICGFEGEGYVTHQDLGLQVVHAGNVAQASRIKCNCQKNLQNKAKKSFRINKSLRKWHKTKPTPAEAESLVHPRSLR